jgi:Mg-chelatase subunit ChlD
MVQDREGGVSPVSDIVKKVTVRKAGGLHDRLNQQELKKEVLGVDVEPADKKGHRLCLMLDCSGSMAGQDIKDEAAAAQDLVQNANMDNTAIAIRTFPPKVSTELSTDKGMLWFMVQGIEAEGGTPLGECLSSCIKEVNMTRGIIISDGQPTDMNRSRMDFEGQDQEELPNDSTKKFCLPYIEKKIPIDTIHIGLGSGEEVLQEISKLTGGIYIKFKDIKSLTESLHYLLPEHRHLLGLPGASELLGADEVK